MTPNNTTHHNEAAPTRAAFSYLKEATMRLGELCAGYGGLGMAVEEAFGATTAWFSEFEDAPSKILAHHWPGVPNHGDMTKIDWAAIEPVDIISGGTPCQDLSAAGRRAGMTEGTRSNLWVQMREAIAIQKPTYVIWENVRGAYSATAASDLEHCPGCMGDPADRGTVLRALGRVLGDLSDLGYDCQWRGLRAADVGAPHGRFRVFVLARRRDARDTHLPHVEGRGTTRRADPDQEQSPRLDRSPDHGPRTPDDAANTDHLGHERSREARDGGAGLEDGSELTANTDGESNGPHRRGASSDASRHGANGSDGPRGGGEPTANTPSARHAEGEDGGAGRCHACQRPWGVEPERGSGERTLTAADTIGSGRSRRARAGSREEIIRTAAQRPGEGATWGDTRDAGIDWDTTFGELEGEYDPAPTNWGPYEPAIRRWEARLGRPAPRPTEPTGRNNGHRLSPRFTEFMMGLPDGWVTDPVIGISRNEQLKACGNGVVPQQAMAALRDMLAAFEREELAA